METNPMADATPTPTDATPVTPAAAPDAPTSVPAPAAVPNVKGDGQQPAGTEVAPEKSTFTQDEVNAIVADRLRREQEKSAKAAATAAEKAKADALKEQGEYQKLWEQEKALREAAQAEATALQLAGLKRDAAAKYKLPPALAERLRGENADEIDADAKALAVTLPKATAPNLNDKAGSPNGQAALTEDDKVRLSGVLGIPAKYLTQ
jgi:hypothetical protein